MKKRFALIASMVVAIGVVTFLLKLTKSDNPSTEPKTSVSEGALNAVQVKNIMTNSDWINGQSQWSRYLEVTTCTENQCTLKVVFSSPQICPASAAGDEWCEETQLNGKIHFVEGGFNFTEDKKSDSVFCELKAGSSAKQWLLNGPQCPTDLTQLLGGQK